MWRLPSVSQFQNFNFELLCHRSDIRKGENRSSQQPWNDSRHCHRLTVPSQWILNEAQLKRMVFGRHGDDDGDDICWQPSPEAFACYHVKVLFGAVVTCNHLSLSVLKYSIELESGVCFVQRAGKQYVVSSSTDTHIPSALFFYDNDNIATHRQLCAIVLWSHQASLCSS